MIKFILSILKSKVINRDLILLLLIGGLYSLGIFLSNTFVNVYLWRQSNDYLTIAYYNLGIYLLQAITFILAGKLAKKTDRIIVFRLGVIFLSAFFLTVLIVGEHAATFSFLLGCLLGIGYGFYWLAFNVLTFEITEPETRDFFNGFLGILESITGMIGPVLAGFIIAKMITNVGYMTVFSISFSLFILAVVCSFFIVRRDTEGKYDLKIAVKEINHNKNWRYILYAHVFQGLREGLFLFVIAIWVFLLTQSEFALGIFNLVLCGFSLLFYIIITKFLKTQWRKKAILIGSIIISFAIYIILFEMSYIRIALYAIVIGSAYPLIEVPFTSMTYDVIGKSARAKQYRIEYIVIRELFVNFGRVVSIIILIILLLTISSNNVVPSLLAIFSHAYLLIYYFIHKVNISYETK